MLKWVGDTLREVPASNLYFKLNGDAHNRRKQYREILKKYPDAIKCSDKVCSKKMPNGLEATIEDANRPYTLVVVKLKGD